jgi:voltage-gated potassium channel
VFSKLLQNPIQRKIFRFVALLSLLIVTGTLGYCLIEHWKPFDALYMTVTTLSTVGFGEVHPLHRGGRWFTIFLILLGVGTLAYVLSDTARFIVESDPTKYFGRKRMKDKIARMSGHQIVCGYGRTGQEVARQFAATKVPFVVIEADAERCKRAHDDGVLYLCGDATDDDMLKAAEVGKALGIVCALSDDTANTFIALSSKEFNENIKIVCRAANPGAEAKMMRAGAHNVISPYIIAGRRMASAVTHPLVLEFLDVAMHNPAFDLRIEQIVISLQSKLAGITLKDANIKQAAGTMVLAVNQKGSLLTNPNPDLVFEGGDILIALGAEDELRKLAELAGPKQS